VGKEEGGSGVSDNEYSCAHGAQINFEDLTPYFAYGTYPALRCPRPWRSLSSAAPDRAPQGAGAAFLTHQVWLISI